MSQISLRDVASSAADQLNVLIADDESDGREALAAAVRHLGHTCIVADGGLEAWERYQRGGVDVVLSDWTMPNLDGIRLCRNVRASDDALAYTHFIFVTGRERAADFLEAMGAGADDYIMKPVGLDELAAHLEVARRTVMLHRRLLAANLLLEQDRHRSAVAARTDPLTAAFNRLQLTEDLEQLASRVLRYGHSYCAALCDIDAFKAYNDCFGHDGGDYVLRSVADAIKGQLRSGDAFYRYGGDEFLVILPEQNLADAALGMERVRTAVEGLGIAHAPGERPFVTISMGVAELNAESDGSVRDWIRRADEALYAAKRRGRNGVATESDVPPRSGGVA